MGGDTGKDQRVYYFNTKEIIGNKYGTPAPVPFRVVDARAGIDMDVSIRCFGEYSYKLTNPMLFYKNVCGNVSKTYRASEIDSQLKSEFLTALQPAFAKISETGIRYSQLPAHTQEMSDALNLVLSEKWANLRGISVISVGVNSVTASEEDEKTLKELQKNAAFVNPTIAAANLAGAQMEAMKNAAANEGGAMNGFIGMGMAMNASGNNIQNLYAMGQQQAPVQQPSAPATQGWTCQCGSINQGNFCTNCGAKRPAGAPLFKCDKCGWQPQDPSNPPKFCPNCGDPFDSNDMVQQ